MSLHIHEGGRDYDCGITGSRHAIGGHAASQGRHEGAEAAPGGEAEQDGEPVPQEAGW